MFLFQTVGAQVQNLTGNQQAELDRLTKDYLKSVIKLTDKGKIDELTRNYLKEYSGKLSSYFFKPVEANKTTTLSDERKQKIDKELQRVMERYGRLVLAQTSPSGMYGQDLKMPYGASDFLKDVDDLKVRFNSAKEQVYMASRMGEMASGAYEKVFEMGQDVGHFFRGMFEAPFESDDPKKPISFSQVKGNLEDGLMHMTNVQKAIDGVAMVSKSFLDKNYLLPNNDVLRKYFRAFFDDDAQLDKFLGKLKGSDAKERMSAIDDIFGRMGTGKYASFATLVIEANYGERAGVLDHLYEWMGNGELKYAEPLEKASRFFQLLATDQNVAAKWKELAKQLPQTASKLMSEKQYIVPNNTTISRDRYDAVTALSFLYAYDKGTFMKHFNDGYATSFLSTIGGIDIALSTPVPCTILQNYKTLDTFYERMETNPSAFLNVVQQLTSRTSIIYQQSFGATFNAVSKNDNGKMIRGVDMVKSRTDAAYMFLAKVTVMASDAYLGNLMKLYMDTPRPPIQLRPVDALTMVAPSVYDIDNIGSELRSFVAQLPRQFDDMNGYQLAADQYLTQNSPGISTAKSSAYLGQLKLGDFEDAYINTVDKVFNNLMSKPTPFKPETGTISGFGNYLFQNFENSIANTNVALSGYNSYMTNSYNRSSNITRDTQTGDKTFENTTINENLNASNVMNPFGIPAQLYNVYVNYMKNVNTSALGEEKVSDNMDGEINAGVRRVGNLYVIFHENSDKENGVWKTKNVTADAYVRRDEGWYRVYFRNDRNGQDVERGLNNRLTEKYAEFSTAFSPSVLVRGGIEQQQQVEQTMALTLALPQNATATDVENLFKGQNIPLKNSSDYAALLALADNGLSNVEGADGKTYKVLRKGNDLQVNSYDETVSRMAFFIGTEIKAGDKRLAVLGIKTPGDNKAAFGSLEVGKTKPKQDAKGTVVEPEEPKIVTLGWMDMTHSEPQFNGYSSVQQPQLPINVQNPSATDSRFIKPKDDIFLASYQVVDRFYGMIMGGGDVAGGVARGRHWGAGAVAQYDGTGVTRFMGNGMVSSEFVDASGFMSAGKGLYPSYGGVATIKNVLKKNWNVVISALVDANIPLNQIKDTASLERILTDFQTLTQEMETETSKPGWQDETKNAQYRADRTADWSRRSIDILERMRVLVPSDILGDIRTEFSVALETGKTVHKISLSQVTGQDNVSQGNYVVTMHSVNFGEKTSVSLVAGVRAYETNMGQPPSPTQVPLPDNFGGMRFKYDSRTSFGYTTYNLFSSNPQAHVFTVAHDFNSANSLKTMLNLKIIPKEGQDIDFYIGNTKFRAKAEYDNLNTMKSVNVAGDYNIGKAIGATLPIFAGGGIRYTDAGQLKMIEPRLHIGSSPSDRISFDVEAGWLHGWTSGKSGRYDTATGTITLRWRF